MERRGRVWRGEGECGEERESVWVCIVRKEDGFWGRDACLSKTVSS